MLTVGYANAVKLEPPEGVTVEVPDPTTIVVKGADKQKVGQFAAEIRHVRPAGAVQGQGHPLRKRSKSAARKASPSPAAADCSGIRCNEACQSS